MTKGYDQLLAGFISAHARRRLRALGVDAESLDYEALDTYEKFKDILIESTVKDGRRTAFIDIEFPNVPTETSTALLPPESDRSGTPASPRRGSSRGGQNDEDRQSSSTGDTSTRSGPLARRPEHLPEAKVDQATGRRPIVAATSKVQRSAESAKVDRLSKAKLILLLVLLLILLFVLGGDVQSLFY